MEQATQTFSRERVEPLDFRNAMGAFATGVAVVTAHHRGAWFGMTMNSLTSVSLDPCLLLICPRLGSATGTAIKSSRRFAISLLEQSQSELAKRFVGNGGNVTDRFDGLDVDVTESGLPLLAGTLSSFECEVRNIHRGGDHDIVIGEVVACHLVGGEPLVFFRGSFGNFAQA